MWYIHRKKSDCLVRSEEEKDKGWKEEIWKRLENHYFSWLHTESLQDTDIQGFKQPPLQFAHLYNDEKIHDFLQLLWAFGNATI